MILNESLFEDYHVNDELELYCAGYILPDGSFAMLNDVPFGNSGDMRLGQHGDDEELDKPDNIEFSHSHPEDDTCVRLRSIPTVAQYKSLEIVIDKYLDKEHYCKVEFLKPLKHKYVIFSDDDLEWSNYSYGYETGAEKVYEGSEWNGYTVVRWIKQNISKQKLAEATSTISYKPVFNIDKFKKYADEILGGYGGMSDSDINRDIEEIYIDGELKGYIGLSKYNEEDGTKLLGIGNFMILERGKGYGTQVINDLVSKYKNKFDLIYCFVDSDNEGAISLYKRLGKVYDEDGPNDNGQYYVTFYDNGRYKLEESFKLDTGLEIKTSSKPIKGSSYIVRSGDFIDLYGGTHGAFDQFCYEEGITNPISMLYDVKINDASSYYDEMPYPYIELPKNRLTSEQYDSLLSWLDNIVYDNVEINGKLYSLIDHTTDDIIRIIKRFYSSGKLYEKFYNGKYKLKESLSESSQIDTLKLIAQDIYDAFDEHDIDGNNQNCMLCTWATELQLRGEDILPRPVYSPRDIIFSGRFKGEDIVVNPQKISIKDKEDVIDKVQSAGNGSRFYCHVNWNDSNGGHEFLLVNIDDEIYIVDSQSNYIELIEEDDNYFNDINFKNSYIVRLDDKDINQEILKYNDFDYVVEWDEEIDSKMLDESLNEAKERKKKRKNQTQNSPVFKSVDDLKKWVKKRQKGLSPFCYLNPNAGNVPLNNSIFNSMFSGDGSSGVSTSEGGISNGGLSVGDAGGGMGESFNPDLKLKLHYTKSLSDYLTSKEQEFIRNNMDLINSERWLELKNKADNTFAYPESTTAIFKFLADGLGYDFKYFEELLKLQ